MARVAMKYHGDGLRHAPREEEVQHVCDDELAFQNRRSSPGRKTGVSALITYVMAVAALPSGL
eukprot:8165720-Heterocapsa_arctica.AAC.1